MQEIALLRKKPRLAQPMKGSSTLLHTSTNGASSGLESMYRVHTAKHVAAHDVQHQKRNVDAEKYMRL